MTLDLKFGAVCGIRSFERVRQEGMALERMGYDSIWVSEHVLFWIPILDGMTTLAAVAGCTRRVQLGTAVYLLPLRHPLVTAKAASTVDVISGGRLILGAGVGGEFVQEFEALGIPVKERGSRTDETIEILRLLWSGERVSYEGRHFRLTDVLMEPKPARPGGPPVWIAGRSQAAIRRAALLGDGYMPYLFEPRRFRESLDNVQELAAKAGRDPASIVPAIYQHISLDRTYAAARKTAVRELTRLYDRPFDEFADRFCVIGTPEQCAARLLEFVEAGVRHIVFAAIGRTTDLSCYRAYMREVVPLVRKAVSRVPSA